MVEVNSRAFSEEGNLGSTPSRMFKVVIAPIHFSFQLTQFYDRITFSTNTKKLIKVSEWT